MRPLSILAVLSLASLAAAQQVVVTINGATDTLTAFSPIDGSLIDANVFPVPNTTQVSAIMVNNELWISEQTGDRVVRYDTCGNQLGVIGPSFPGGGFDNIRGMVLDNGIVYVTNDGSNNGATADSLVTLDTAGNHLATIALTNSTSPFAVIPFQGDILVVASQAGDDVHRYTTAGVSVGTFHDSGSIGFGHHGTVASDGNVWVTTFTSDTILKLDAATGSILQSFAVDNATGVYELQNGNLLWAASLGGSPGVHVCDVTTGISTQITTGASNHLNLVDLDFACHKPYGAGCHAFSIDQSNLMELFADVPSAKAALDGNALQFTFAGIGYIGTWLPGTANALYVPPSAGATIVANVSTGTETFTPSLPTPIPGGVATDWTISSEGILTAGTTGNQGTDTTPSLADTASATGLAFYTWATQNPTETGSGKIKWEEVGTMLYVTFDGVELTAGSPSAAPSTYQWQINMATGDVTMLWTSFSASNSTVDVLVGCTLADAGKVPTSQSLAAANGLLLNPDPTLLPMTLSASPAPVINPNTVVTYTLQNAPVVVPGSGIYLGTMWMTLTPFLPGLELAGILTTVPGCSAYIGSLDLAFGAQITTTPTMSWTFDFSNAVFSPGFQVATQAIALFDGNFPLLNGESGGLLMSNGVLSTTFAQ